MPRGRRSPLPYPGALRPRLSGGLDSEAAVAATGLAPITDPKRSLEAGHPAGLIDAKTRKRQLFCAEIEYRDELREDPSVQTLAFLRPDAESRITEVGGTKPCHLDGWTGEQLLPEPGSTGADGRDRGLHRGLDIQ